MTKNETNWRIWRWRVERIKRFCEETEAGMRKYGNEEAALQYQYILGFIEEMMSHGETADDSKLPKLADLKGVSHDATGNLSSVEFVRRIRNIERKMKDDGNDERRNGVGALDAKSASDRAQEAGK